MKLFKKLLHNRKEPTTREIVYVLSPFSILNTAEMRSHFTSYLCQNPKIFIISDLSFAKYDHFQALPTGIPVRRLLADFEKRYVAEFAMTSKELKITLQAENLTTTWHGKEFPNKTKLRSVEEELESKLKAVHCEIKNDQGQWELGFTLSAKRLPQKEISYGSVPFVPLCTIS